jgi:hypothetical protein
MHKSEEPASQTQLIASKDCAVSYEFLVNIMKNMLIIIFYLPVSIRKKISFLMIR